MSRRWEAILFGWPFLQMANWLLVSGRVCFPPKKWHRSSWFQSWKVAGAYRLQELHFSSDHQGVFRSWILRQKKGSQQGRPFQKKLHSGKLHILNPIMELWFRWASFSIFWVIFRFQPLIFQGVTFSIFGGCKSQMFQWSMFKNWVVVLTIFYFQPYLGKFPILTNIFQRGWNHQIEKTGAFFFWCFAHRIHRGFGFSLSFRKK